MSEGSAHYAGSLPVVSPTTPENDRFADGQSLLRKRTSRAFFLIAGCTGVVATFAWWSSGDAARRMIADWYPQLGWLAPQAVVTQTAADTIEQITRNVDRIVATSQEQITRSVDQLAADQEQTAREISKLQAVSQYVLSKNSEPSPRPTPAPIPKPWTRAVR